MFLDSCREFRLFPACGRSWQSTRQSLCGETRVVLPSRVHRNRFMVKRLKRPRDGLASQDKTTRKVTAEPQEGFGNGAFRPVDGIVSRAFGRTLSPKSLEGVNRRETKGGRERRNPKTRSRLATAKEGRRFIPGTKRDRKVNAECDLSRSTKGINQVEWPRMPQVANRRSQPVARRWPAPDPHKRRVHAAQGPQNCRLAHLQSLRQISSTQPPSRKKLQTDF